MSHFGEELAFLKTQALALQNIPVTFDNDYQPALADVPKKVFPFQITILPPPTKPQPTNILSSDPSSSSGGAAGLSRGGVSLIIKSTKPSITFTLQAHPTDTIAQIKAKLTQEHPRAPEADDQRLLLKGKVLADAKLLKEYPISTDATNITLMTKPGSTWTGEERKTQTSPGITVDGTPAGGEVVMAEPETIAQPTPRNLARPSGAGHARSMSGAADEMPVPSVTLSPMPDTDPKGNINPNPAVQLDMDLNMIVDPPRAMTPTAEGFHHVISDPEFWQKLIEFLRG
ncbi:hypothetical protein FRB93_007920 [Tulasnella sp. JGI-2019a]|nr:hypothetical protein FRB93_007920 [Tulasnella sp. JGI-2019a]